MQYNVPGGKKNRALALVYSYKMLVPKEQYTDENIKLARILGWCTELVSWKILIKPNLTWIFDNNIIFFVRSNHFS